jgi:hypothetical protein
MTAQDYINAHNYPFALVCKVAKLGERHLSKIKAGTLKLTPKTAEKIEQALKQLNNK